MANLSGLFNMQITLILIMLLGTLLTKCGLIHDEDKNLLSNLVLTVTLPASIIRSFQIEFSRGILLSCGEVLIVALLIQIGAYLLGLVLYPMFHEDRRRVLQYATICSNAGVLGNPVAAGVYGDMGLLYASIYVLPQRIFMWSIGLTFFTEAPDFKSLVKKVVTHPCIIAVVIGLFIMVTQIPLPDFVQLTLQSTANANTFLAMLMVGVILAEVPFKELAQRGVWYYAFVRLFLIPLLVILPCRFFHVDALVTGVCVLLSGMPAASVTAVLASKYGRDSIFATKCVVLTTLLSMVTAPLWCFFMG